MNYNENQIPVLKAHYSNGIEILNSTQNTDVTTISPIFHDSSDYDNIKRQLEPIRHICELWQGIADDKQREKIIEYIDKSYEFIEAFKLPLKDLQIEQI